MRAPAPKQHVRYGPGQAVCARQLAMPASAADAPLTAGLPCSDSAHHHLSAQHASLGSWAGACHAGALLLVCTAMMTCHAGLLLCLHTVRSAAC